uniref:Uncharacterized protein n=1 Tax=Salix viminalis TaxID=40686 RepID=A0A6N2KQ93_SALVM
MELNVAIIVFLILFSVGVVADYSIHNISLAVTANRFGLLEDTTGIPDYDNYSPPPDLNERLVVVLFDDPEPQPASPPQPTPYSQPSRGQQAPASTQNPASFSSSAATLANSPR